MIKKATPSTAPARKRRPPSSQMPKIQVNITRPQEEFLNSESERLDITVADLVRRIIDAYREGRGK
jgi:hypothetical protein